MIYILKIIFLNPQSINQSINNSVYFAKQIFHFNNEWQLHLTSKDLKNAKVNNITISGNKNYVITRVSYWCEQDAKTLAQQIELMIKNNQLDLYYDYAIKNNVNKFNISIQDIGDNVVEIDSISDLIALDPQQTNYILSIIFKDKTNIDAKHIERLGGMSNTNFLIKSEQGDFVLRLTSSSSLVNRDNEIKNSHILSSLGIDAHIEYIDEKVKITRFIENSFHLEKTNIKNYTSKICELFRKIHNLKVEFVNNFNPFEKIIDYENACKKVNACFYDDYDEIKKKVFNLEKLLTQNKLCPCHSDPVAENFIIQANKIYLIDWEYCGQNDPLFDISAFCLENDFNSAESLDFLTSYLNRAPLDWELTNFKIYLIAIDLLWSNWAILKKAYGIDYGDYGENRFNRCIKNLEYFYA